MGFWFDVPNRKCLVTGHFCPVTNSYSILKKSGSRNPKVFGKLRKATAAG